MEGTKKLLSVVTAVFIVMTVFFTLAANADELGVTNGGFDIITADNVPSGWTISNAGGTVISDDTVRMGDSGYSVKIIPATTGSPYIQANSTGTDAGSNKIYTISGYFYVGAAGSSDANIRLYTAADNWGYDKLTINSNYVDGKWHSFKRTFKFSGTNKLVRIEINAGNGYTLYFDNMTVKEESNVLALKTGNYSGDYDVELAALDINYNIFTAAPESAAISYESQNPISGNYSLKLTTTGVAKKSGPYFYLTPFIQTNVPYKLSFKTKAVPADPEDTNVSVAVRIYGWNSPGYDKGTNIVATKEVQQHEIYFMTNGTTPIVVYLNMNGASDLTAGDSILFDEFKVETVQNTLGFKDANGNDITSSGAGNTAKLRFVRVAGKDATSEETVNYIVALYSIDNATNASKLENVVRFGTVTSTGLEANVIDTDITMPEAKTGVTYVYKSFIWDGEGDMTPIINSVILLQSN